MAACRGGGGTPSQARTRDGVHPGDTRLLRIIESGSDADALRAIQEWTNRAWGRPTEKLETTVRRPESVDEIERMTEAELDALLAQTAPRLKVVGD